MYRDTDAQIVYDRSMKNPNDRQGATVAAKAAHFLDVHSGAVVPEIQLSTTFARDDRYTPINAANLYSRDDNPTFIHAERTLADLENGEECRLFASGMAAIASIFYSLTPGSHVVLPDAMYCCLLYTSPSPRDRTRSRMPSSA